MLYWNDRKKGEGGILAYVPLDITCKWLQTYNYKTIEPVLLKIVLGTKNVIVAGLQRPPKSLAGVYQQQLKDELNHMCNWLSLQGQIVVLIGDFDKLWPDKAEGRLLIDIEEMHGMECLITQSSWIQTRGGRTIRTLVDVILTNHPDMFIHSGIYDPDLSDHPLMIYRFM